MISKPRNRTQQQILEVLETQTASVVDLANALPVSAVYIRQQLLQMIEMELIEKVDNRQPYIYQKKALDLDYVRSMELYKQGLLATKDSDIPAAMKLVPVVKMVRSLPKAKWLEFSEQLLIMVDAIHDLDAKDKLIDTL